MDDSSESGVPENVVHRDEARFGDGIQDALRRATMRGVEPFDRHSLPRKTQLDALLLKGHRPRALPSWIRYAIFPPAARGWPRLENEAVTDAPWGQAA
jgi:hypothetical protein